MLSLPRMQLLSLAAAAGILCCNTPGLADELVTNLGPVGPHEPILTAVGDMRIIAFYEKDNSRCNVQAVAWDNANAGSVFARFEPDPANSAVRVRISLSSGQVAHIDTADNESLSLQCRNDAATLALVDNQGQIAVGSSKPKQIEANISGF